MRTESPNEKNGSSGLRRPVWGHVSHDIVSLLDFHEQIWPLVIWMLGYNRR
jgi:hypothetical protein